MEPLTFNDEMLTRRRPSGIDIDTTLAHFALVTYRIDPEALRPLIHPRFELDLIDADRPAALLSVVPFVDQDFRFSRMPWPKWRFGQTNYRVYVTDSETGEHVVWFIGTSLDSVTVAVPRRVWKLPWHRADIRFDCTFDPAVGRYTTYRMRTTGSWADAHLELDDTGKRPAALEGFDDLETGLVLLTHPRRGYYFRRDGKLGSYAIWHDRLHPTVASVTTARFDLLDRLGLVDSGDVTCMHSALIQNRTAFTIYLPPGIVESPLNRAE